MTTSNSMSPQARETLDEIGLLVRRTVDTVSALVEYTEKHPDKILQLRNELTIAMAKGTMQGLKMQLFKLFF